MKKTTYLLYGALFTTLMVNNGYSQNAEVGFDFVTAYVYRGGTVSDNFHYQPYLKGEVIEGLVLGTWGSIDNNKSQFIEVDYYASYELPLGKLDEELPFGISVGYIEYTYPNSTNDADREFGIVISADEDIPLSPSVGFYYAVDGAANDNFYTEASVSQNIEIDEEIGLGLGAVFGYLNPDKGQTFSALTLSTALEYSIFTAGIDYVVHVNKSNNVSSKTDVVGRLGFAYEF